jgi:anti-sigma-K factor RskA
VWHPDDETLAGVALGMPDDETAMATAHVHDCDRCAGVVAGYRDTASLVAAVGVARSATGGAERWEAPSAAVWDRVQAEIDADAAGPAGPSGLVAPPSHHAGASPAGAPGVPDLATVPSLDEHRERRDRRTGQSRRGRPRWTTVAPWAAGAAAAGIAIGLLTGHGVWGTGPEAPAPTTLMAAPLDTLDSGQRKGEAVVVTEAGGLDLTLQTARLEPAADGYLEVWLINTDGKRMVSVGILEPGATTATFPVSRELMDQGYRIVDISREPFDDKPQHSGDSLLRGELSTI